MSIRCGNHYGSLGEHTHDNVEQVKNCCMGKLPAPSATIHQIRPDVIEDNIAHDLRVKAKADIPAGRYALMINGRLRFFKVDKPTKGRWVGYTFIRELFGAPGSFREEAVRSSSQRDNILGLIVNAGASEAASLFGQKLGCCGRCMSPLTDVRSRAAGYGETCARHLGWTYPSQDEAYAMLNERALDAAYNRGPEPAAMSDR